MVYSQSLTTVQELPSAQEVAPVYPLPPQRPQRATTDAEAEAAATLDVFAACGDTVT